MKSGRPKGVSFSSVKIAKCHEQGAILFLWLYDLVKFWLLKDILAARGIDPVIFLFYDMVTVPPFIIGSARLVNALAGTVLAWPQVLGWGGIVLVNTFLPYVYAAVAGEARFTARAWGLFWSLVLLVLANLIRTIRIQVVRARAGRPRSVRKMKPPEKKEGYTPMGSRMKKRVPSSSAEVNPTSPFR